MSLSIETAEPGVAALIDPAPLVQRTRNWTRWAGMVFSFALLGVVIWNLRDTDVKHLVRQIPVSPVFWLAFAGYYLAGPLSEMVIYKRLWNLPNSALTQLLGKQVSNELLLGYSGEVYFYAWAKRHAQITTAPFGAIKDVAILSAMMGNAFTLLMVLLTAPSFGALKLGVSAHSFIASAIFVLVTSLVVTVLRNRLFSLPRKELQRVAVIHSVRIVVMILLAAVMWHDIMPSVLLGWWLLLGTVRQLVSRLPFVPNKDVVFAGVAAFMVGSDSQIVDAVTLLASLIMAAHLVVGAGIGLRGLIEERARA